MSLRFGSKKIFKNYYRPAIFPTNGSIARVEPGPISARPATDQLQNSSNFKFPVLIGF